MKQKQTHRYSKQANGSQVGGGWGWVIKEKEIKKYKLPVIQIATGM